MGVFKKLLSAVSVTLTATIAFTFPVQAVASNLSKFSPAEENDTENPIVGELVSERDEYTKYFRMSDGSTMAAQYEYPVHYKDNNDEWVEYNNSLSEVNGNATEDEAGTASNEKYYKNQNSNINVNLSNKAKLNNMIKVEFDDYMVSWGYKGTNYSKGKLVDNTEELTGNDAFLAQENLMSEMLYENIYDNIDLQCLVNSLGVKENFIIKSKNVNNEFVIQYKINNLNAVQKNEREISLTDKNGKEVYIIEAPYMTDSAGNGSSDVSVKITNQKNNKLTVTLSYDKSWLEDDERVFPVTLDPTFTTSQKWNKTSCAYVDNSNPNTSYGYGSDTGYTGTVYVGTYGSGMYRTYIKLNELPKLNKGDIVVSAQLNMHLYQNSFYDDMYIGAYPVTSDWSQKTITWNNSADFSGTALDYEKLTSDNGTWHDWDITNIVKKWYNGSKNYGVVLKSTNESDEEQCASFYSGSYPSSSIPRPVIAITYRNNKGLENYWSYSSFSVGTAGTAYINDYSGNLTFITSDNSTVGSGSVSLQHIFNGYTSNSHFTSSYPYAGKGWKLNYQQTLYPSSKFSTSDYLIDNYPYVYTDEDGTDHYFIKETIDGNTTYKDEDGLKLELTINSSSASERYTIKDDKNNKLIFNSDCVLVKTVDSNSNAVKINLDSAKGISTIEDACGDKLTFNRNSEHCITKVTNSAGKARIFRYDNNDRLIQIQNPDNGIITFEYDNDGSMTSVTDTDGYKVVFGYSSLSSGKKVTSVTEYASDGTAGQKITFSRNEYNLTNIRSAGLDGVYGNSDDCVSVYQFDNLGRTISVENRLQSGEKMGAAVYSYTDGQADTSKNNLKNLNRVTTNYATTTNVQNLLKNHSLESSTYWSNINQGSGIDYSTSYVSEEKCFGQKSLKVKVNTAGEDSRCGVRQTTGNNVLVPGKTYTLSAYVKTSNILKGTDVGALIGVKTEFADGTFNQYNSEHITGTTDKNINNGWQRIYTTFTVPENTTNSCVYLAVRGTTGTAYFDGVQLEEGDVPNKYNLLQNSNFETTGSNLMPTFWGNHNLTLNSSNDTTTTYTKCDGRKSFKIRGDVTKNKQIYQDVPVSGSEDDTYIFSAWSRGDSVAVTDNDTSRFDLYVEVRYSDGSAKGKKPQSFNKSVGVWQYSSFVFNLSDETDANKVPVKVTVFLRFTKQYNTAYFDNAQLIKDSVPSYTYNDDGELVTVTSNAEQKSKMEYTDSNLTKSVDAKGYAYTYDYDDNHNMTKATSQNGVEYNYTYNSKGQATALEANNSEKTLALKSNLAYTKDGRFLDKLYDQDGNCDTYNYNSTTGYLDSVKDNDTGAQINYTYDENRGQLISVSQTDSYTDITAQNNYTYDESGKLLTKINHSNTDYIIDYDKFYNTTENKVGSQVLTAFDYGTNNNILQKVTYGNGQTVNYNYDKYGNVKELFYNGKLAFSFLSDKTGTVMRHKDFVNNRQYDYDYDTTGRLVRQVKTDISKTDAENKFVSAYEYDYDLNNNVTKLASKNGDSSIVHSFTYGKDNLLTEYSSDVSSKVTYTYDGLNRQTKSSVELKTPLDMSYTYYDSNRGENFTTTKIKEETIAKDTYKYEYDTNGNITDIYKKVNNDWQRLYLYEYDEFNQLITSCDYINQKQYRYDYDEAGNILTETVSRIGAHGQLYDSRVNTYGYDDANWGDKLTSYNGETITYDEIGNPLSYRDGMEMTWLNGRKLTTLQSGNDSISYKYDSNGVRTSKTVNGVEYTYEYLNGKLMHETRGEKVFDYCYDANGQLYAVSYKANSSTDAVTYYYAHNWRGDITSIYDGDGNMVAKYEYDDWGNVLTVTDANNKSITDKNHIANLNPFRYRSYYYDSESGLYYLMSRYYDPVTHRFVNADGYFQSGDNILDTNMNAYCQNNPGIYIDTGGCFVTTVGFSGDCTLFWGVNASICAAFDGNGDTALQFSYAGTNLKENPYFGVADLSASMPIGFYWDANSVDELSERRYFYFGGSAGFGGFLGVDLVFSEYGFAGIVINPGGGLGADFHTYTPTTNTIYTSTSNTPKTTNKNIKKNMNKNNTNNNKIHNKNSQKYCRACGRPIGKGPGFCSSPSYY